MRNDNDKDDDDDDDVYSILSNDLIQSVSVATHPLVSLKNKLYDYDNFSHQARIAKRER